MNVQRYESYWTDDSPSLTDPLTASRRRFLWERVAPYLGPNSRLLDCGAGDGGLLAEARARGIEAAGIEIAAAAIERARRNAPEIDIKRHSLEELPWPVEPASWDVVVSFEVIEHLLEPRSLLKGAHTALVAGGTFFASTPYHGLVKNLAVAAFKFESHFAVDGDHIRFFTDGALRRLIEMAGFEVVEIAHLGRVWPLWANTVVSARKT